jgi:hypothetical protein
VARWSGPSGRTAGTSTTPTCCRKHSSDGMTVPQAPGRFSDMPGHGDGPSAER